VYGTLPPPTTTKEAPGFLCANGGTNCNKPAGTTTRNPSAWGEPVTEQNTGQSLGDLSARKPTEAAVTNADIYAVGISETQPPRTTAAPAYDPIVVTPLPMFTSTAPPTTFKARGVLAGIWQSGAGDTSGGGHIQYPELAEEVTAGAAPPPSGPPPTPAHPGVLMSLDSCPEHPLFDDRNGPIEWQNGPPAGLWTCELNARCGQVEGIIGMLFLAGGTMVANVLVLLCFGCLSGTADVANHPFEMFFDNVLPYFSFVLCVMQTIMVGLALVLAASSGMSDLQWRGNPVVIGMGAGATCGILCLVVGILACIVSLCGIGMRVVMQRITEQDKVLAKISAQHVQEALEQTEEWKLEQDAARIQGKPAALGWRSIRVHPDADYALEDGQSSQWTPSDMTEGGDYDTFEVPALALGAPFDKDASRSSIVTIKPQRRSKEIDPQALRRSSFVDSQPLRGIKEMAPSPAVEKCVRDFVTSGEGAVYAQHFPQLSAASTPSSSAPASARAQEWVPKVSRSQGVTYWVNAVTGETRWDPPEDAAASFADGAGPASAVEDSQSPPGKDLWKKKKLKSGILISVKVPT